VPLELLVERGFMENVSLSAFEQLFRLYFHDAFLFSINVFEHDNFLYALGILAGDWYFIELDESLENIGVFL
jgi:hypothetical protein